jgi:hypothetical protein
MRWRKLGLVHVPDGSQAWARSHSMLPTPLMLSDEVVRLYVAHADESVVSRIGYIDLDLSDPTRVIGSAQKPILDIGEPGAFDDNGVNPCCAVRVSQTIRLFYTGYQLHRRIPYTLFAGLAQSDNPDGPFVPTSRTPILDRRDGELFFRTAPLVLYDSARWRMWYVGGEGWVDGGGKLLPLYSLRHTESTDGLRWDGASIECLAPDIEHGEIGFGRPFVLKDSSGYRMWYPVRRRTGYVLGYATSPDGLAWTRLDNEVGIDRSDSGWDSEMICYPAIVPSKNRWLMFYNGNGYGRTGVGVAELMSM